MPDIDDSYELVEDARSEDHETAISEHEEERALDFRRLVGRWCREDADLVLEWVEEEGDALEALACGE